MKIVSIMFEKKVTKEEKEALGQYSNETLRMEATVGENESPALATVALMDLVHGHLGVEFNSDLKDMIAKKTAEIKKTQEEMGKVKLEVKEKDEPRRDAKEEQGESGQEVEPVKEADVETSVPDSGKEEEVKEVKEKVKKKTGAVYDRSKDAHVKEYARLMDKLIRDWRKNPETKKRVGEISRVMEGKVMYTTTGNIAAVFTKEIKKLLE